MNAEDFMVYYRPAAERIMDRVFTPNSLDDALEHFSDFDALLGIDYFKQYAKRHSADDFPIPQPMRELLTALAGPHGKTILKAYWAKKGLTNAKRRALLQKFEQSAHTSQG